MIYAIHRHRIPEDHPRDAACVFPAVCEICGRDEPYDCFAGTWFCKGCLKPFLMGFWVGRAVGP